MRKIALWMLMCSVPALAQVKITRTAEKANVEIDGKPFTEFHIDGEDYAKPFLHPLIAANGAVVTRYWPMDKTHPGESTDHPHHRGLWFGHGDVNGLDFWANEKAAGQKHPGKQIVKNMEVRGGAQTGTIRADIEWTGPDGVLMVEHRTMTFYSGKAAGAGNRQIDFDLRLEPKTKVIFGDTKEGTFSVRLAPQLEYPQKKGPREPARTGVMVNAEGAKGEENDWGKASAWMDYSGVIDGAKVGVAIFDHPGNPRHPNRWHTRGYGLFGVNLFGVKDFDKNAPGAGPLTLEPGQELRYRFRVLIHAGDAESAKISEAYGKYAK